MDEVERVIQNFLAHHGIKGMHWGIRRDLHPNEGNNSSRSSQSNADREYEQHAFQIRSDLASKGVDSDRLKAKYGPPPSSGSSGGGLTENEKKALEVAGAAAGIAVVGAAGIAAYRMGLLQNPLLLETTALKVYKGATETAVTDLWETGIDLPAGHIFSRVSTIAEKSIRDGGFFAAHNAPDLERYKAVLPTFWKQWGIGSPKAGGYVNNYEALVPIKAPTGQEATSIFKDLLKSDPEFRAAHGIDNNPNSVWYEPKYIAKLFEHHSQHWAGETSPVVQKYFDAVKARGYNALVDYNDAGKLSKIPVRVIDGKAFRVHSNDRLEYGDMRKAAKKVARSLKHSYSEGGVMDVEEIIQNALAHHGVKGMHWGIRKPKYSSERATESYLGRVKTMHNVNRKIGAGQGTIGNKFLTGSFDKRSATAVANEQAAHIKRLESGKYHTSDLIVRFGALSVGDIHAGFSEKKLNKNLNYWQKVNDKQLSTRKRNQSPAMAQTAMEIGAGFLEHHGVKGMHWGIRKDRSSKVTVVTDPTKRRKKIKTSGGHDLPPHGDAIKARTNQQRLAKSGTDALSNTQLQDLQTRLNLEQNVSRLHKTQRDAARPWIIKFLKDPTGRKQLRDAANSPAAKAGAGYVKKSLAKKAATAAVVVAA